LQNATQTNDDIKRVSRWTVVILFSLGVVGAVIGVFSGLALAQRFRRSIVKLNLTVQDAAGRLNEVTEPVTLSSGGDIQDVEQTLSKISERISAVVTQLHQSQREVLRAEQLAALGQLAAGLAHEFRNPLTAIKILVQSAALDGDAGHLSGKDLVILEKEISRLERSIQNFLDFARPPRLERQTFDMRLLVQQTLDLLSARAASHAVRWNCVSPDDPVLAHADMGQIRQVILNLLLNGLDVLPQGGTIGIELQSAQRGVDGMGSDGGILVRVVDDGPGLPAELGERIFEPFISTKETGLGLGLSICKGIVEAHGGTITGGNRPEGGTVFSVRLPRAHAVASDVHSLGAIRDQAGERDHAALADRR
jgi:signal transduction histidine kinase